MKVEEKIYRARIAAEISQTALALRLEKSQIWISRLERGVEKATPEVIARVLSEIERAKALRESVKR
jgi:transcriptional regulator with XRE-family HTH domain